MIYLTSLREACTRKEGEGGLVRQEEKGDWPIFNFDSSQFLKKRLVCTQRKVKILGSQDFAAANTDWV